MFVTAGEPASIAAGMQKVLAEPGLMRSLSRNGRALYARHFCLARFFANLAGVRLRYFGIAGQLKETLRPAQGYDSQAGVAGKGRRSTIV